MMTGTPNPEHGDVAVGVGVAEGVAEGVADGVPGGVSVADAVAVTVADAVAVAVADSVAVGAGSGVAVGLAQAPQADTVIRARHSTTARFNERPFNSPAPLP